MLSHSRQRKRKVLGCFAYLQHGRQRGLKQRPVGDSGRKHSVISLPGKEIKRKEKWYDFLLTSSTVDGEVGSSGLLTAVGGFRENTTWQGVYCTTKKSTVLHHGKRRCLLSPKHQNRNRRRLGEKCVRWVHFTSWRWIWRRKHVFV